MWVRHAHYASPVNYALPVSMLVGSLGSSCSMFEVSLFQYPFRALSITLTCIRPRPHPLTAS